MAQASVQEGKKQELELNNVLEYELPEIVISQEIVGTSLSKRVLKFIKKDHCLKEIQTIDSVKNLYNFRQRALF